MKPPRYGESSGKNKTIMRFKFTLFMFFISLFLCTRVMADNRKVYYGFLEFEVIDESAKTVSVTGYRGSTTVLTIPSIFKDDDNSIEYKVVEISSLAFSFSKISKIELPNTLLKIGTAAFPLCEVAYFGNG